MAWACMAVSGTGPLNFNDDLTYNGSSRMNSEGYKTILATNIKKCHQIHQKALHCNGTMTQNTLPVQSMSLSGQRNGKS